MAENLKDRLIEYMQDAHAMVRNSLNMLRSMLDTTDDPDRTLIEHHVKETELHKDRLEKRLQAVGADTSSVRDPGALVGSAAKGMLDKIRSEKPSKNARDAYVTEQVEIAAYELLSRLADRAEDSATAEIARQNLQDERAMAEKLSARWDRVIDLTLAEEGITL